MRVLIISNADQEREIGEKETSIGSELVFKNEISGVDDYKRYDAFFILNSGESDFVDFKHFSEKPVFINSVTGTLKDLRLPNNVSRINAWSGFLQREIWEVASENTSEAATVFNKLGWKIVFVKDEPGLVAARVIAMIINEAFFAFNENVSSIEEIDLAMKLGTNYPFGPFEWGEKIGLKNVFDLLKKLAETDARYEPSSALENCI